MKYSLGWKRQQHDSRDLKLCFSPKAVAALPSSVSLLANMPPPDDQGALGSCGPSTAYEAIQYDQRVEGIPVVPPSRLFIYYIARLLMGTTNQDSGVDNRTMLKALNRYGFCPESMDPYNDQGNAFMQQPSQACFQAAVQNAISNYAAVTQNLDQMRASLASGHPFVFGFTVFPSMMTDAVAATGKVPMPGMTEQADGGHDVLIHGYDDASGMFRFRNHWVRNDGQPWGDNGDGYIPYQYATSPNLAGDFWAVNAVPMLGGPPTPNPTPTPVPVPIPPGPSPFPPLPPGTIKAVIDSVFVALEQQFAAQPMVAMALQIVQNLVDNYLVQNQRLALASPLGNLADMKPVIDMIFAALISATKQPWTVMALKLVQSLVDEYLSSQIGG